MKPRGRVKGVPWLTCSLGTHLMDDYCPYCSAKTEDDKMKVLRGLKIKEHRKPKKLW